MRTLFVIVLAAVCGPAFADLSSTGRAVESNSSGQRVGRTDQVGAHAFAVCIALPSDLFEIPVQPGHGQAGRDLPTASLLQTSPRVLGPVWLERDGYPMGLSGRAPGFDPFALGLADVNGGPSVGLDGRVGLPGDLLSDVQGAQLPTTQVRLPAPGAVLLGMIGLALIGRVRNHYMT